MICIDQPQTGVGAFAFKRTAGEFLHFIYFRIFYIQPGYLEYAFVVYVQFVVEEELFFDQNFKVMLKRLKTFEELFDVFFEFCRPINRPERLRHTLSRSTALFDKKQTRTQ